jgi:hypothetical protein
MMMMIIIIIHRFAATLHVWLPFHHPQPKDAPCGDRDPVITVLAAEIERHLHKKLTLTQFEEY